MRSLWFALPLLVLARAAPASADCNANADIEAAFTKQRQSPAWRSVVVSDSNTGERQEQTFDYVPPDRMYRKVVVPGDPNPLETIGVGRWAWSNVGGGWTELQPQFAQMVQSHMQEVFAPPRTSAAFSCLGTVNVEGKDYTGYQTAPEGGESGDPLVRTIYVDPATGLPAFNIIGPAKPGAPPVIKETYTYPADIVIESPLQQ